MLTVTRSNQRQVKVISGVRHITEKPGKYKTGVFHMNGTSFECDFQCIYDYFNPDTLKDSFFLDNPCKWRQLMAEPRTSMTAVE